MNMFHPNKNQLRSSFTVCLITSSLVVFLACEAETSTRCINANSKDPACSIPENVTVDSMTSTPSSTPQNQQSPIAQPTTTGQQTPASQATQPPAGTATDATPTPTPQTVGLCASKITSGIFDGGDGSSATNPYLVSKATQIKFLSDNDASTNDGLYSCYFKLTADIDLTGISFKPIAKNENFNGEFDGNNHTISNLTIDSGNATDDKYIGFFANTNDTATIKNLTLANVNITVGFEMVGALVGYHAGTIDNCAVSGTIKITPDTAKTVRVGGLVGDILSEGEINKSQSSAVLIVSKPLYAGGLVAFAHGGKISDSFTTGNITVTNDSGVEGTVGGFIGLSAADIRNSYSTGVVTTTNALKTGGFAGAVLYDGKISFSYSTGAVSASFSENGISQSGGLIGHSVGYLTNSYSSSTVSVQCSASGNCSTSTYLIGGLVGYQSEGAIDQCYATGNVTTTSIKNDGKIGGFVGATESYISNSYTSSNLNINASDPVNMIYIGEFTGGSAPKVWDSYSTGSITTTNNITADKIAGFARTVGGGTSRIFNSFWNTTTSNTNTSATGDNINTVGKTTAELKTATTFSAWNSDIWNIQNGEYPTLFNIPKVTKTPSTFYFCNQGSGLWSDSGNWFTSASCTTAAGRIPKVSSKVVIQTGLFTDTVDYILLSSYQGAVPSNSDLTAKIFIQQGGTKTVTSGTWGGRTL